MANYCKSLWRKMWRKKTYTTEELQSTELKRCLSLPELTLYGVGQTIGTGIYVLSGAVVRLNAGPAAPLSYLMGGLVSMLSALCYAEFSTIIPRAGSSYSYTYYTIGQWVAYVIGWDLMLEHSMVAGATGRALASSLDLLLHNAMKNWTIAHVGEMNVPGLAETPEFLAGAVVLIVAAILLLGAKQSIGTTAVLAFSNIVISLLIVGAGLKHADFSNWSNTEHGGYLPFGIGGVMSATAIVFSAYSGYDAVCTAAEESKDPNRTLPIAIISTMTITMIVYCLLTSTLTLASPYYTVDPSAAFTKLFQDLDEVWAANIVTAAIMIAAFAVSLCNMFAVSRIAFAMARDGVLFKSFAYVNRRTGTPTLAVLAFAVCTAVVAVIFDVEHLAEVVSVGTLMAATIVPLSVIVLRYRAHLDPNNAGELSGGQLKPAFQGKIFKKIRPESVINVLLSTMTLATIMTSLLIRCSTHYAVSEWTSDVCLVSAIVTTLIVFSGTSLLCLFEQNTVKSSFRIPLVPFFPAFSVFLNVIFLGQISDMGWLRYAVWMIVGSVIYFGYGVWMSDEGLAEEIVPLTTDNSSRDYLSNDHQEKHPAPS